MGDRRLSQRLVDSVLIQSAMPSRAFCAAAQGVQSAVKGYYRLAPPAS
ncbi:MAG: hypothetical protein KA223_10510 [Candidatus Accumulibacter sp.]|nr:hypothetical protein [Accumulibacter sp.]